MVILKWGFHLEASQRVLISSAPTPNEVIKPCSINYPIADYLRTVHMLFNGTAKCKTSYQNAGVGHTSQAFREREKLLRDPAVWPCATTSNPSIWAD